MKSFWQYIKFCLQVFFTILVSCFFPRRLPRPSKGYITQTELQFGGHLISFLFFFVRSFLPPFSKRFAVVFLLLSAGLREKSPLNKKNTCAVLPKSLVKHFCQKRKPITKRKKKLNINLF